MRTFFLTTKKLNFLFFFIFTEEKLQRLLGASDEDMDEIKAERVERIEEELEKMRLRQHISNKNETKKALEILGKSESTISVSFIF